MGRFRLRSFYRLRRALFSKFLTLTDFLEGEVIEGLTAAVGEAILSPQLGRICNLLLARRLKRMTPCSGSYGFPPRLTSFFSP
jgi:hypothetical protein